MSINGQDLEVGLHEYFRERLTSLSAHLNPSPHEDTLWYMGNMLARFGESKDFFCYESERISIRPLALLYKDAYETANERNRCMILRQLGDMALFMGALFPENFARKGIRKDYFVGMGGGAYDYLADNAATHRHVFSELANTFTELLELVAEACDRQTVFDPQDILMLYQRWLRSGEPRLAAQLEALGINTHCGPIVH